jgi:hypothetical protein
VCDAEAHPEREEAGKVGEHGNGCDFLISDAGITGWGQSK